MEKEKYLIGTFCIVNCYVKGSYEIVDFDLIGTFCIVNYEYSDVFSDEAEFNRNILYCKLFPPFFI